MSHSEHVSMHFTAECDLERDTGGVRRHPPPRMKESVGAPHQCPRVNPTRFRTDWGFDHFAELCMVQQIARITRCNGRQRLLHHCELVLIEGFEELHVSGVAKVVPAVAVLRCVKSSALRTSAQVRQLAAERKREILVDWSLMEEYCLSVRSVLAQCWLKISLKYRICTM